MGEGISLADSLLCGGGILEPGRRRPVRLFDQSAHRVVLHARPEYDPRPWPCRTVWSLWHAGNRPHAVLPSRPDAPGPLEIQNARVQFLVNERRPRTNGLSEPPAGRAPANLGER